MCYIHTDTDVAVKDIDKDSKITTEVNIMESGNHPNITLFHVFDTPAMPYLIMELAAGEIGECHRGTGCVGEEEE